ncbi:amino acid permease [Paenibacillus macerans]|uniref:Amino acid permease family protein n=1 Tax=Paenibacillus macerans TaxID=44252 RepID=A0A090ZE43_PAEMA|nr:amino acid permease [Paenibacillus macerans]KFN08683.1 amino acid permease family protein [Paenibacillus macerans]MCY7560575.1 amino acid permease [Paenibacillus macerans]MEC0141564.1 amino acid permease [Paenibacillus macerans]MEC0154401.1 amino acid permease [Paenibacillus macerans]MEC0331820.1 amino acid permease [Paenibacillus macerans]
MSNKKTGTDGRLNPGLKARHMTMIALGGSIGTGLFLASGGAIASAGPGGALLAYAAVGIMVYFLMTSLGELATYLPDSGSFETYASRFVDPSLGFAMGWNFWYNWAITIAAELSAATLIIKYWFPNSPSLLWSVLFLALILGLNILSVKGYGESEYWFATIKIAVVIIFLVVGVLMIFGIMGGEAVGFSNFTIGDGPFHGGFFAFLGVFMAAGFSFQGTEMVGVAAGESNNPREHVPRAIRQVFWRILLFYILAILVIGLLIPYTNPNLLKSGLESIGVSPFTLVFEKAGLAFAASVMNAVILSSVLSAGNSGMYASSRVLYSLALRGKAPKFLGKLNRRGIPVNALLLTTLVGMLAFLASLFGDGVVYNWLLNASGMCGFITWLGIAISHYRFRRAYMAQGRDLNDLPYKARWFPFGPIFAFILCFIVILGQNLSAFSGETIDWYGVIVSYISVPLFLLVWLGYKWTKKSKLIPLDKCDLEVPDQR